MAFLELYLNADTPTTSGGGGALIAVKKHSLASKPYNPNDLFFDTMADIQDRVSSEMSPRVDPVVFEYQLT
jgi:hypothetical protein